MALIITIWLESRQANNLLVDLQKIRDQNKFKIRHLMIKLSINTCFNNSRWWWINNPEVQSRTVTTHHNMINKSCNNRTLLKARAITPIKTDRTTQCQTIHSYRIQTWVEWLLQLINIVHITCHQARIHHQHHRCIIYKAPWTIVRALIINNSYLQLNYRCLQLNHKTNNSNNTDSAIAIQEIWWGHKARMDKWEGKISAGCEAVSLNK